MELPFRPSGFRIAGVCMKDEKFECADWKKNTLRAYRIMHRRNFMNISPPKRAHIFGAHSNRRTQERITSLNRTGQQQHGKFAIANAQHRPNSQEPKQFVNVIAQEPKPINMRRIKCAAAKRQKQNTAHRCGFTSCYCAPLLACLCVCLCSCILSSL